MTLESRLEPELWDAVRESVEARNYSGAILDAVHFLGDVIRERSGSEGDGAPLVGQAFGGNDPRLKVTRLQSESDWNVQRGIEQLLRGIYLAVRNPRSHQKIVDNEADATAILLFIDYLLRIIGQSRAPFSKAEFIRRVLDADYVETSRYAELLVEEIPEKKRLEICHEVYRLKPPPPQAIKLRTFFEVLIRMLDDEQTAEFCRAVSDELKTTEDDSTVVAAVHCLPPALWPKLAEVARLRVENKMIRSVKEGRYDRAARKLIKGGLGTWLSTRVDYLSMKAELASALRQKLSSNDRAEREYVLQYFSPGLRELIKAPDASWESVFLQGLKRGDERFKLALEFELSDLKWSEALRQAMEDFTPVKGAFEDEDDLPF